MASWRIACVNFDHGHVTNLLEYAANHPEAEIVALCDAQRDRSTADIEAASESYGIPDDRVYFEFQRCLEEVSPDIVCLCPAAGEHADWVEQVLPFGTHVLLEKPYATSLDDAHRIAEAVQKAPGRLLVNWPYAWYSQHRETKRLIEAGQIGEVQGVHYYDGNSGPPEDSWFFNPDMGGGSLLDFLGYGATFATWFRDGELPERVNTTTYTPSNHSVDRQSVTVASYGNGLSTFQTSWQTFTDPWEYEVQPTRGFVIVGDSGTIQCPHNESILRIQTQSEKEIHTESPPDVESPYRNPVEYFIDRLESGASIEAPLSVEWNFRVQRLIESAIMSAQENREVELVDPAPS